MESVHKLISCISIRFVCRLPRRFNRTCIHTASNIFADLNSDSKLNANSCAHRDRVSYIHTDSNIFVDPNSDSKLNANSYAYRDQVSYINTDSNIFVDPNSDANSYGYARDCVESD